ncbi:unnamed protein product [Closterium sp. NIES-53]
MGCKAPWHEAGKKAGASLTRVHKIRRCKKSGLGCGREESTTLAQTEHLTSAEEWVSSQLLLVVSSSPAATSASVSLLQYADAAGRHEKAGLHKLLMRPSLVNRRWYSFRQVQEQPPGAGAAARCLCTSCSCSRTPPGIGGATQGNMEQHRVTSQGNRVIWVKLTAAGSYGHAAAVRRQPCARSSCRTPFTAAVAAAAVRLPSATTGGGCTLLLQLDCHRPQLPPPLSVAAATTHMQLRIYDRVPGEAAARTVKW